MHLLMRGGIGGLTLAVALSRIEPSIDFINDIEVDIYEASSQLTQIGTGITLWPRAWKILVEQLGLGPSLLDYLSGQQVPDDEPRKVLHFSSEKVTKITGLTSMTLFLLVKFCQSTQSRIYQHLNPLST